MNGRLAKRLRRENKRPRKKPADVEWPETADFRFDKKLYWERRNKGLPGMIRPAVVHQFVLNDKGKKVALPVSGKYPPKSNRPVIFVNQHQAPARRQAETFAQPAAALARSNSRGE